jgi:NADH:ubiquinone oxidoreductase subunit 6 (subunit J)
VVLRVEYFAFTMLIIYIGAVSILFLFVIMMLGSNVEKVLKFSMKINKRLYYLVVSQFGLVFGWYWFNISKISAFS